MRYCLSSERTVIAVRIYKVTMNTPLGNRSGTLGINIAGNKLDGFLQILKSSNPIVGVIDNSGLCNFSGHIDTAAKTLRFTARGVISEQTVELTLLSEDCQYLITGGFEKEDT